jgi:TetR/AcrR family fatty acid metabolism transcriptional regulator
MPRKVMSDRQKQANRSKQKIAKAALSLFQKKGYQNVTIEDICKKADISVGGFYHHFRSKNAVFEIVMSEITEKVNNYVRTHPRGSSVREDLRQFLLFFAQCHQEIDLGILQAWLNPSFCALGDAPDDPSVLEIAHLIQAGQSSGEITEQFSSHELTTHLFVGAKGVIYDWCLHAGSYDLIERMNLYIGIELCGIAA